MASKNTNFNFFRLLADHINQLSIKEEKSDISNFSGETEESSIQDWFKECHNYATIYNWKKENFKQIFGSRLRGDALTFHAHLIQTYPDQTFEAWRQSIINKFKNPMAIERKKIRFLGLRQKPTQSIQHFIDKLTKEFNSIYEPTSVKNSSEKEFNHQEAEDILLQVFWNGICPKIKDTILNSHLLQEQNWHLVTEAALRAEKILLIRGLTEAPENGSSENQEFFGKSSKECSSEERSDLVEGQRTEHEEHESKGR